MLKRLLCLCSPPLLLSVCFSLAWGSDRGPINSGETKIGFNITAPSYLDTWTFQGNYGDRVVINAVTTSGTLDTRVIVYPPGGGPAEAASYWYCSLGGSCGYTDQLDWQLQSTGLYTIVVEDGGLTNSGTYNISLLQVLNAVSAAEDPDGGAIASGETRSGVVNVTTDMDAFHFYGNAGDRAIVSAVTTAGALDTRILVYPPGGGSAEAASYWSCPMAPCHWTDQLDWQLQSTGLYTIVVEDGGLTNSGTYNIALTKIPAELRPGIYNPSPQNGGRVTTLAGSFTWDAVPGATGYDLYLRQGRVDLPTKIGTNVPTPSMALPELEAGNVYYWEVIAHTPGGDLAGPVWWFEVPATQMGWLDDFEVYIVGTFPFPGGWSFWYDGGNQSSQHVDNAQAASGSKSLHLAASASGYPAAASIEVGSVSRLKLEAEVFVDQIADCNVHPTSAAIFLMDRRFAIGATFGAVRFSCDGNVYAVKDNLTNVMVQLMPYSAQLWYRVALDIDLRAMSYDVYINGALQVSGVDILNSGTPTSTVLAAGAMNVWFDNVKILPKADAVGVFRPSDGTFYLDYNASGQWDGCGTDSCLHIGMTGDIPLVGDWSGSGTSEVGLFRPSDGTFYLDYNGSGVWDGCGTDRCLQIGLDGDIPLVGDWNGSGTSKVGAFRPSDGTFYLDFNGSGTWEGCGTDRCLQIGMNGDIPLVGDWNGGKTSKVGAFRPSDGTFYLDYNGNGQWDGCGTDRCLQIGMLNDTPLVGDWNGIGTSKVGVFRPSDGTFYLDYNGSGTWEGCGIDRCLQIGMLHDTPLVGDWNGTGPAKVGVFRPSDGTFYLDYNGSGTWEGCGTDRCLQIGLSGDTPLVGKW